MRAVSQLKLAQQYEARYGRTLSDLDKRNLGIRGFQKGGIVYASEGRGIDGETDRENIRSIEGISSLSPKSASENGEFNGRAKRRIGEDKVLHTQNTIGNKVVPTYEVLGNYNTPVGLWKPVEQSRLHQGVVNSSYQFGDETVQATMSPEARRFWQQLRFREDITEEQKYAIEGQRLIQKS